MTSNAELFDELVAHDVPTGATAVHAYPWLSFRNSCLHRPIPSATGYPSG